MTIAALCVGIFIGTMLGMIVENQFDLIKDPERKRKIKL